MKRRQFLSCATVTATVTATVAATVAATGGLLTAPARALVIETAPPAIDAAYALRCQVDPVHAGLLQEARDKLGQNKEAVAALDALAKDLKQALTCPFCGCNLALDTAPGPVK